MPLKHLRLGKGFAVQLTNARSQVATMVIAPGDWQGPSFSLNAEPRTRSATRGVPCSRQ